MSVIDSSQLLATGDEGYQISRSVRLRSSASAYFSRTFTTPTDNKKWTWSGWVKRGKLGTAQTILGGSSSGTGQFPLYFTANDQLAFYDSDGVSTYYQIGTTAVFRDPSAWYHIVAVFDSANATQANRLIIYVNNASQTLSSIGGSPGGLLPLNRQSYFNASGAANNIGCYYHASAVNNPLDGYIAESFFIDGQALTPSSFGEYDSITGVWKPKRYAGTYGTNGFYLNFSDNSNNTAATIGKDYSGNGNNWTPNNISVTAGTTYDSMIDTPTPYADGGNGRGNYAVMNPLSANQMAGGTVSVTNGNLTVADGGTSYGVAAQGTIAVTSGKWYWEVTATTVGGNYGACGIRLSTLNGTDGAGYFYLSDGTKVTSVYGGGAISYGASYTSGAVIGVALDMDAGTLTFYKNNASQGTAYTGLSGSFNACVGDGQNATQYVWDFNFGQRPFAYTPPTGYTALNTQNLPDSTIKAGNKYFDAVARNGFGTSGGSVATNFQADLLWEKPRNSTVSHYIVDSVRGITSGTAPFLSSNTPSAESNANWFNAPTSSSISFNSNDWGTTTTLVDWIWKKGATPGFDIVTYTGTGVARTISHSLGVAPKMMIVKPRGSGDWIVYHTGLGSNDKYTVLDGTADPYSPASTVWNSTAPTSSVFSVGTASGVNTNTATYVAYLFAEVAGFSRFGSYTGNLSIDGPFVYCGFKPRYLLIKNVSISASWEIIDTSRDPYNVAYHDLYAESPSGESTGTNRLDILSNGFKIRDSNTFLNGSGNTVIYAAFAENPFKYSLAR